MPIADGSLSLGGTNVSRGDVSMSSGSASCRDASGTVEVDNVALLCMVIVFLRRQHRGFLLASGASRLLDAGVRNIDSDY